MVIIIFILFLFTGINTYVPKYSFKIQSYPIFHFGFLQLLCATEVNYILSF
jgi:hypothetical protein